MSYVVILILFQVSFLLFSASLLPPQYTKVHFQLYHSYEVNLRSGYVTNHRPECWAGMPKRNILAAIELRKLIFFLSELTVNIYKLRLMWVFRFLVKSSLMH